VPPRNTRCPDLLWRAFVCFRRGSVSRHLTNARHAYPIPNVIYAGLDFQESNVRIYLILVLGDLCWRFWVCTFGLQRFARPEHRQSTFGTSRTRVTRRLWLFPEDPLLRNLSKFRFARWQWRLSVETLGNAYRPVVCLGAVEGVRCVSCESQRSLLRQF
jgi:hypothetical protein